MFKDLILQILGKKKPAKLDSKKIDENQFKYFKFKPLNKDNNKEFTVVVLKNAKLSDYKRDIVLLKLPRESKEYSYLKTVWNDNFPEQIWK